MDSDKKARSFASWTDRVSAAVLAGLQAGRAPWLPATAVMGPMPFDPAVSDGSSQVFGALSAVWLSSQAMERGLADPRWMTLDEAGRLGARIRRGEKATQITTLRSEAVSTTVSADGLPQERRVSVTRPEAVVTHVFNASQMTGLSRYLPPAPAVPAERVLAALPARMGLDAYSGGLKSLVGRVREALPAEALPSKPAAQSLADALSVWMLARRLGAALPEMGQAGEVKGWCELLEQEPLALAQAARTAARVLRRVMPQVLAIEKEALMEQDRQVAQQPDVDKAAAAREKLRFVSRDVGDGRVFLHAPKREDVDRVKALGARWDKGSKLWYVPAGKPIEVFEPWIAQGVMSCGINPAEVKQQFAEACRSIGLVLSGEVEAGTEKFVRCSVEGRSARSKDGAYKLSGLHAGQPHGYIKNFHTGQEVRWTFDMPQLSAEQRALLEKQAKEMAELRTREVAQAYELRAGALATEFAAARDDVAAEHPYLQRKQVGAFGVRVNGRNDLLVPLRDVEGKLWSYQRIEAREGGAKLMAADGKAAGMFHLVGAASVDAVRTSPALLYAEGYATAASLHEATGLPVAMTVSANNIGPVVAALKKALPEVKHVICADNDLWFPERVRESMVSKGLSLAGDGSPLPVEAGPGRVRQPDLPGCHFDGQWHQADGGRYCVTPERVNGVVVALGGAVENKAGVQSPIALGNTGVREARAAAAKHGVEVVVPVFDASVGGRPTDFNDLAVSAGAEQIRRQMMNQLAGKMPEVSAWLKTVPQGKEPVGLGR